MNPSDQRLTEHLTERDQRIAELEKLVESYIGDCSDKTGRIAELARSLSDVNCALPATFYAALELPKRVRFMAEQWNKSLGGAQELERQKEELEHTLAERTSELKRALSREHLVGDALDEVSPDWEGEYEDAIRKLGQERDALQEQMKIAGIAACTRLNAKLREERDALKEHVGCQDVEIEQLRELTAHLKEERDELAALGLAWTPIEQYRKGRYCGEPVLVLPVGSESPKLLYGLPDDFTYTFRDADDTYYEARLFTHFMPMPCDPDSQNEEWFNSILAIRLAAERKAGAVAALLWAEDTACPHRPEMGDYAAIGREVLAQRREQIERGEVEL